jgi:flagellar assembly protein FliH
MEDSDDLACSRWDIPQIDELLPAVGGAGNKRPAQSGQRGYDEGFTQGREDALVAGRQAVQSQVEILQRMMLSLTAPFAELDEDVETALLELATAVARQVVRRELATDPELVLAIIREAISLLPVAARRITLQLHPEDARLVQEHMSATLEEGLWRIVEDPACARGGCIVTTEHTRIDASLEQQIERIATNVLGAAGEETVNS